MSSNLRPCPFCGGEALIFHENGFYDITGSYVGCRQCGAKTKTVRPPSDDDAISAWNTRYTDMDGKRGEQ